MTIPKSAILLKHGTGGVVMTVIEFAEKRLNESCINDDDEAALLCRVRKHSDYMV